MDTVQAREDDEDDVANKKVGEVTTTNDQKRNHRSQIEYHMETEMITEIWNTATENKKYAMEKLSKDTERNLSICCQNSTWFGMAILDGSAL